MACRIILMFNMPVIQVYIVELYLFNRYNQRRDSMISWFHLVIILSFYKVIDLDNVAFVLISNIEYAFV